MKYFFQATLKAHVDIPDKEFEFIKKCCEHHYDSTIKDAIQVGGFLYGFTNRRDFSHGEDKILDLTFRQIDIILKALEVGYMIDPIKTSATIRFLSKILVNMNEKSSEINKQLDQPIILL